MFLDLQYADEKFEEGFVEAANKINKFKALKIKYFEYVGNHMYGITFIGKILRKLQYKVKSFEFELHGYSIQKHYFSEFSKDFLNLAQLDTFKLNLDDSVVSCECIVALLNNLSLFNKLRVFHFRFNTKKVIMNRDIIYALKSIRNVKVLRLELRDKQIDPYDMIILADGLKEVTSLNSLFLDISLNRGGKDSLTALSNSLSQLKLLKELRLFISKNSFNTTSHIHLAKAIQSLDLLTQLEINFGKVSIEKSVWDYFGTSFGMLKFLEKLSLKFFYNDEQDLENFYEGVKTLRFLNFLKLNIGSEFMALKHDLKFLVQALLCAKNIETLFINFRDILIEEQCIPSFVNSITSLRKVMYLRLSLLHSTKIESYSPVFSPLIGLESLVNGKMILRGFSETKNSSIMIKLK
jgi:hypothetical protein